MLQQEMLVSAKNYDKAVEVAVAMANNGEFRLNM